jgi:hypothetical protein
LDQIEATTTPAPDTHPALDSCGMHKHPYVKQRFQEDPRHHPHFTPTNGSRLNRVER